ncbi:MAG: ubiquitin-like small modifier protein 1 [Verrucomicrobiota bacterium]
MSIEVSIPTPLRNLTAEKETVEATGATIGDVLDDLNKQYPGIGERLLKEDGSLNRFVNIYVNGEDIRFLEERATPVKEGDEVSIVPAIAGG